MPTPNAQMAAVLKTLANMGPLPIETLTPEVARQMPLLDRAAVAEYGQHLMKRALAPLPLPVGAVEHRIIPGPAGELLVRIYKPTGSQPTNGWPVHVFFHGGGFVIAGLETYDSSCRHLCQSAQCVVFSVHYRQAPEHPWPAATEDAFAAYQWVLANADDIGGDALKVTIGGESAGGNLAAVVCLMARDQGIPMPVHQLLIYPVTDLLEGPASASAEENAEASPLNTPMLHWFYGHFAPEGVDRANPYVSPLHAETLAGLPPATIVLAEIDPLRSEGESYAKALQEDGVAVDAEIFLGVTHEFFGLKGLVAEANDAVDMAAAALRKAVGRGPGSLNQTGRLPMPAHLRKTGQLPRV